MYLESRLQGALLLGVDEQIGHVPVQVVFPHVVQVEDRERARRNKMTSC